MKRIKQGMRGLIGAITIGATSILSGCPQEYCPEISLVNSPQEAEYCPGTTVERRFQANDADGKVNRYHFNILPNADNSSEGIATKIVVDVEKNTVSLDEWKYEMSDLLGYAGFNDGSYLEWNQAGNNLKVHIGDGNVDYSINTIGGLKEGYFNLNAEYQTPGRTTLEIFVEDNCSKVSKILRTRDYVTNCSFEGEGENEGEIIEGEGEVPLEGEGENEGEGECVCEGEGEVPLEGEGENEGEPCVFNNLYGVIPRAIDNPSTPYINEGNFISLYKVISDSEGVIVDAIPYRRILPNTEILVHHIMPSGIPENNADYVAVAGNGLGNITEMNSGIGGVPLENRAYLVLSRDYDTCEKVAIPQTQFGITAIGNATITDLTLATPEYLKLKKYLEDNNMYFKD
ncbi:MAG TPA: hypothetical protein P5277_04160 [Candidatus Paceibacterota bacterium]|nr:hypothetical protein [Candidatus Paceibacterota bacterium]